MTRKGVLLSLVWVAAILVGVVNFAHADSSELAAINAAIHAQGKAWVAGETAISKLPPYERALRARLIKPQLTGREVLVGQTGVQATGITPGLDWRNNLGNFVTPVRDQRSCGSCWAFATTAALESFLLISQPTIFPDRTALDLSEQILVSCGGAGDCNGGYIDRASNYVRDTGLPVESYDTYTATNATCPSGWPGAAPADKSQGWAWVTTTSVSVNAIKNALTTYGPLITTMDVYNDFFSYAGGVYQYTSGSLAGGHAVLIVGYADDTSNPSWGGGYFIVKNSWGTIWGDRVTPGEAGFFKIAYSETSNKVGFGEWTIADTRAAPTCTYTISPTSASVPANGGSGSVNVITQSGCSWTATSNATWISIAQSTTSGTGSGTVGYSYQQNPGQARTGTATIAGKTFTVSQAAANIAIVSVSPTSVNFGPVRVGKTSTKNVTISNRGGAALTTFSIGIMDASDFSAKVGCGSIAPNGSCTVQVTFRPSSRTSKSASLSISWNDPVHSPISVPLSGKGN